MDSDVPRSVAPLNIRLGNIDHPEPQIGTSTVDVDDPRVLAMQWNAGLPISRLPPEILIVILVEYATTAKVEYYDVFTTPNVARQWRHDIKTARPYAWIHVTHVCRLWRDVALQYPHLWCWIIQAPSALIQLMLQRSGQAPLCIDTRRFHRPISDTSSRSREGSNTALPSPPLPDAVHENWYRIQEANIDYSNTSLHDISAPALRVLNIYNGHPMDKDQSASLFLPHRLSSLRNLSWYAHYADWLRLRPLLLPHLETLHIELDHGRSDHGGQAMSVDGWISALRSMPGLRTLSLTGAIDDLATPTPPTLQPGVLPRLRDLSLSTVEHWYRIDQASSLPEVLLLASLDVPQCAHTRFTIRSNPSDTDIDALLSTLSTRINDALELTLSITGVPAVYSWTFSGRTSVDAPRPTSARITPAVTLQASFRLSNLVMVQLFSRLSYSHITNMRLVNISERTGSRSQRLRGVFAAAFRSLVNMTVLAVEGLDAAKIFLDVLEQLTNGDSPGNAAADAIECPLPSLRDCAFDGVLWRDTAGAEKKQDVPLSRLAVRLATTFVARRARGTPLHTLHIKNAKNIAAEDIDYIRSQNFVDAVEWDVEHL